MLVLDFYIDTLFGPYQYQIVLDAGELPVLEHTR